VVSMIFLLYDFAVSRQSERQQVVLDTKRRYVRFISHEIRTPLNTIRLGLKLFDLVSAHTSIRRCASGRYHLPL
jgi:signal transduction histidine kinase